MGDMREGDWKRVDKAAAACWGELLRAGEEDAEVRARFVGLSPSSRSCSSCKAAMTQAPLAQMCCGTPGVVNQRWHLRRHMGWAAFALQRLELCDICTMNERHTGHQSCDADAVGCKALT